MTETQHMVNMRAYLARKTVYVFITFIIIISFNFFLFRIMPGDPTSVLVPKTGNEELKEAIREAFGLNKPLWEQYFLYIKQVFTLDWGISTGLRKYADVTDVMAPALMNTIILLGTGTVLAIILGINVGKFAAWRRGTYADAASMSISLTFYSMPTFLFALFMLMIFAGYLKWFPIKGSEGWLPFLGQSDIDTMGEKILSRLYHLVLPLIVFTLEIMAEFAIIMRNSLTDVLTEDYIVTARAKGLSNKQILDNHAMRNAMLPVVTVMAIGIAWVLGGTIMVEMVFSYDGLGLMTWDAVVNQDYALLQALFLLFAVAVLIANAISDVIYFYLDPRVEM
ncbi:MAG: ABC transporter permease [Methanobacteriota archaeon]|nr:MAG: ABC transporter permease [Euryarchaeota archaeon]